jgi:hypothetical protein
MFLLELDSRTDSRLDALLDPCLRLTTACPAPEPVRFVDGNIAGKHPVAPLATVSVHRQNRRFVTGLNRAMLSGTSFPGQNRMATKGGFLHA